jgi:predicted permease
MLNGIRSWLRNMRRRSQLEESLDRELRSCLEIITTNKVREGMDPAEARRQALIELGGVDTLKDHVRDTRRGAGLDSVVRDFRYAARMLRRQPLLAAGVILTLSIGIGGVAAVFTLLDGFVFRTPVSRDPNAFFRVTRTDGGGVGTASLTEYTALRTEARSARALAAWSTLQLRAPLGAEDPTDVPGLLVTCNFFDIFGVDTPVMGRLLDERDCTLPVPVAVLSEGMWRNRLGGDPSVIGAALRYGPVPITIVGVVSAPSIQREASDPDPDFVADLWFPYSAQPTLKDTLTMLRGRDFWNAAPQSHRRWLELAGLLQPGISRQQATAEFRLIETRLNGSDSSRSRMVLTDGSRWASTPGKMLIAMLMALALPGLVMLVACMNAAALLLSRAIGRHKEMAIRLALGTSKTGLVRMLVIESLLLSGLAAAASLVLVYTLPPLIVRILDAELWFGGADFLSPDWRVFACLGFSAVVAAVLSGLTPALESLNPRLTESLQGRPICGSVRGISPARRAFVGVQVAASMVLLVTAMTFSRTAARVVDPGFRTDGLLVAEIRGQRDRAIPMASLAETAATAAGVESVAYARTLPLVFEDVKRVRIPGASRSTLPLAASVSKDYFDVFGIPILAGRPFGAIDVEPAAGAKPIVISRQLAHRAFAGESAVGEILETGDRLGERSVIIGIAGDRPAGLAGVSGALTDGSMIYELMNPSSPSGYLLVKTKGDGGALTDALRSQLRDFTGSPTSVRTFGSILAGRVTGVRRVHTLLVAMGLVSLVLAVIGVSGAVSSDAIQRQKEFAIRLALGAAPWDVRWRVVLSGLRPVPAGVSFGALASWGTLKVAESARILPLGSVARDATPYITISVALLAVALATLLAVAYQTVRRDPLVSLREE